MRKAFLIASAIGLLCCASAAFAADVPQRAAPVYQPAAASYAYPTWSGFYLGANALHAKLDGDATLSLGGTTIGKASGSDKGWGGNAYAGYDWQIGNVVFGPELGVGFNKSVSNDFEARLRLGYAINRFLPYVAAGGDCAKLKKDVDGFGDRRCGWSIGGGVEAQLIGNWSARAEFVHNDYGSKSHNFGLAKLDTKFDENLIRAGVNYRW